MIVHVRNFGKIESADIDLSDFTIFVGENNSGKSYLMQLIYGLENFIIEQSTVNFLKNFDYHSITNDSIEIKKDDANFYNAFRNDLNRLIKVHKENIIERTFHTRNLKIESLSIEFNKITDDYSLEIKDADEENSDIDSYPKIKGKKIILINKNGETIHRARFIGFSFGQLNSQARSLFLSYVVLDQFKLSFSVINPQDTQILYLPASRSGLMLLYTNFFANNNEDINKKNIGIIDTINDTQVVENEFGLTQPVYDFLTFLLKHKTSEMISDDNKAIITFIDKKIINGSMEKAGNTMRYKPASSQSSLPIYLSSSLVSELTPIYQILSGIQRYKFILYDEIETCQHPTKQLQLARLLVRMVNAGYRMIVSTHSDTMASAINNLVSLSFKENKNELISKLGYEPADILNSNNVNAYQFVIGENGKTKVLEVPQHFSIGVGFDFNLFNNANNKIYEDAVKISEVD